jgi:hypothetical protein
MIFHRPPESAPANRPADDSRAGLRQPRGPSDSH